MTVLMLGRQLELGHYRAEFLQSHGFHVIFPESKSEALAAIQEAAFDAAIISYTLSKESAQEFVARIEEVSPDCSLVAIVQRPEEQASFPRDETVLDVAPPKALLDALIRIEKRKLQAV
jgi:DNA-binding response OmpR family regulator